MNRDCITLIGKSRDNTVLLKMIFISLQEHAPSEEELQALRGGEVIYLLLIIESIYRHVRCVHP